MAFAIAEIVDKIDLDNWVLQLRRGEGSLILLEVVDAKRQSN